MKYCCIIFNLGVLCAWQSYMLGTYTEICTCVKPVISSRMLCTHQVDLSGLGMGIAIFIRIYSERYTNKMAATTTLKAKRNFTAKQPN